MLTTFLYSYAVAFTIFFFAFLYNYIESVVQGRVEVDYDFRSRVFTYVAILVSALLWPAFLVWLVFYTFFYSVNEPAEPNEPPEENVEPEKREHLRYDSKGRLY